MPITLHNLGGKRGGLDPEPLANFSLNLWIDMGMGADRAANFADADPFARLAKPFFGAPELVEHERELEAEGDRLGVNAVAATDHRRHFVFSRLRGDRFAQLLEIVGENLRRFVQLHGERGIENVG